MSEQEITPEQAEAMKEKIKNMSPEELKEFYKKQCIFCQIISGKVPSNKVYEDDICIAILDINPANKGHILLIPREHFPIMPVVSKEVMNHLSIVSKALSQALLKTLGVEGTTIFVANGAAAGQRAQHFMMHIVPREDNDKIPFDIPKTDVNEKEYSQTYKVIVNKVSEILNSKEKIVVENPKETEKHKEDSNENSDIKNSKPSFKEEKTEEKKDKSDKDVDLDDITRLFK